jgi:hypothetical protein
MKMSPQVAFQLEPTGPLGARVAPAAAEASIELYWLPLGAGGWFVRLNGRIWEAIHARRERRRPLDLYHTALVVRVPEGRYVVENCWPIPDANGPSRGVAVEGPVASRRLGRWRVFRYEVRCWPDGVIADANETVASPQPLSDDPLVARRLLELVRSLPSPVWGRDELGAGEMWNSNSVIAWLLARAGLPTDAIPPPAGGRAPGWQAGLAVAHRSPAMMGTPSSKADQAEGHDAHTAPRDRKARSRQPYRWSWSASTLTAASTNAAAARGLLRQQSSRLGVQRP